MATPRSIYLANINPGKLSVGFVKSMLKSQELFSNIDLQQSGPYLDDGRNKVAAKYYFDSTDEWILYIDSDISWEPEHVTTLLDDAIKQKAFVVAGTYNNFYTTCHFDGMSPVIFEWVNGRNQWTKSRGKGKHDHLMPIGAEKWEELKAEYSPALVPVTSVGTGFLLIHRSVLTRMKETIPPPRLWFDEPVINGYSTGEDLAFCLRASLLGFQVYANPNVHVTHVKELAI